MSVGARGQRLIGQTTAKNGLWGKVFVFEEVANRKERDDCWLLISGKVGFQVYDVTQFLEDHPGGDEVLLAASGKDATQDFEDVGHSDDARNMMKKYYIGEVDSTTVPPPNKIKPQTYSVTQKDDEPGFLFKILQFLVPLLILGLAFGFQFLGKKEKTEA
ncbi:hypothetical protein CXB51_016749 [Gossypium anomalum]|uniref:Cytochrome b5 heme-binding domain-containing protein n=1 Tax=Gossypium anomalum TaxID=47600 RepID=A0A8J5YGC1_9ROSI|nr:hypothetical protein CXB51_016749 [Gossypium anomalum]